MEIYVISDSHFGHKNMVEWALRPQDFDEKIWKGLSTIPEDAVLIHCGDVSMGSETLTHMKLHEFKFKKWLILGNHDNRSMSWYLRNGWDFVAYEAMIKIYGKSYLFSHIPLPKREGIDKNIHGHLHGGKSRPRADFYDENFHIEVCPEVVGYMPIKLSSKI